MQSQSTDLQRNQVLRKNNFLISDIFKLKNRSFRTFCISKGCFLVVMKKRPLEAKLNGPKREDQNCKYSKRIHLLCFRRTDFCNFTILKSPSRGNETVYR